MIIKLNGTQAVNTDHIAYIEKLDSGGIRLELVGGNFHEFDSISFEPFLKVISAKNSISEKLEILARNSTRTTV